MRFALIHFALLWFTTQTVSQRSSDEQRSPTLYSEAADGVASLRDTVLVGTLDGGLHALNRDTGKLKWSLTSPWTNTQSVSVNSTSRLTGKASEQAQRSSSHQYLIEPSGKGQLWLFVNGTDGLGTPKLHKLPLDIAQLVEASPLSLPGGKLLSGSKTSRLIGIDLQTGQVRDLYGKEGRLRAQELDDVSTDSLDHLEAQDMQHVVNIGRVDYSIVIHQASFSKHIKLRASAPLFDLGFDDHLDSEDGEDVLLHFSTYTASTNAQNPQEQAMFDTVQDDGRFISPTPDGNLLCGSPAIQWMWKSTSQPLVVFDVLGYDRAQSTFLLPHPTPSSSDKIYASNLQIPVNDPSALLVAAGPAKKDVYVMSSFSFPHVKLTPLLPVSTAKKLIQGEYPVKEAQTTFWPSLTLPDASKAGQIAGRSSFPLLDGPRMSESPGLTVVQYLNWYGVVILVMIALASLFLLRKQFLPQMSAKKIIPLMPAQVLADDEGEEEDNVADLDPSSKKGRRRKRGKRLGVNGQLSVDENGLVMIDTASSLTLSTEVLGSGSHGTMVFKGALQGRAVAVKRMLPHFTLLASHEISILHESDTHPNVIRYFLQVQRPDFLYIVVELAECSLADLIEHQDQYLSIAEIFQPKAAVEDILQGLRHLHDLKLCHRDLKPANILLTVDKKGGQSSIRCLISDMGLCKRLDSGESSFPMTDIAANNAVGTVGWRAPEILSGDVKVDISAATEGSDGLLGPGSSTSVDSERRRLTRMVDIFAAGLVMFYIMSHGQHPFGDRYVREANIIQGRIDLNAYDGADVGEIEEGKDLISRMLVANARGRVTASQALLHPFFWSASKHLSFLTDTSDRFEIIPRDRVAFRDPALIRLELNAEAVVGQDWAQRLDNSLLDNLGKFRKYEGKSVQDLLRALRNKKHHYQDLPLNVQAALGTMPDGFLRYFTSRFPRLVMHLWAAVHDTGFAAEPMFNLYFK